jgi:hypothetical protein
MYKWLLSHRSSCCVNAFLFNTSAFTTTSTLEEKFCTANTTGFIQLNRFDIGRKNRKCSFNTYTIGDFPYSKGSSTTLTLAFDYIATEALDTLFTTFDNFIVYSYIVTRFKLRELFFSVNCSCINWTAAFMTSKFWGGKGSENFQSVIFNFRNCPFLLIFFYFATFTARFSLITVTLIWPG